MYPPNRMVILLPDRVHIDRIVCIISCESADHLSPQSYEIFFPHDQRLFRRNRDFIYPWTIPSHASACIKISYDTLLTNTMTGMQIVRPNFSEKY